MKKVIENFFEIISAVIIIWVALSFIEVAVKHENSPKYCPYNAFVLFVELGKEI